MALLDVDQWAVQNWFLLFTCERCGVHHPTIALRKAATAYHDPAMNVDLLLCDACAEEYYEYWGEMWKEYERSRG